MTTSTIELTDRSTVTKVYEHFKQTTGGNETAAAVLALAETLRQLSTGVGADHDGSDGHPNGRAVDGLHKKGVGRTTARRYTAAVADRPTTATHERAPGAARNRSDRNRADLTVIEDFLPPEETKRLAEFLDSVGKPLGDKTQMQELLPLVVHYVTKIRKVKCEHSHIHTVLKKLGVSTPTDLGARLRDVGRRSKYLNASNGNDVQLTMKGENWIDIELPKEKVRGKKA